ncbi:calcium-translocating P-type ATPase, SERCA-type, partial [Candidatus Woesearchaeota archaeon]|nr:calcium-translocating P-type ATPase, SERCA-type [Candidatus Woesearchaeota archaeon]
MEHYKTDMKELFVQFSSSENGLSSAEAKRRLDKYGPNELKKAEGTPWWKMLLGQFNSPLIWILLAAVVVSIAIGEVIDALVIGIILVINAVLGFLQEFKAEKAIDALKKMAGLKAVVIRDGKEVKIDASEVVPGDIILIETGEKVPADARIIEASNLETQEAALTG